MVGQSHPKPVVPNVEYQRSLNSLASSIHSTPSTAGSQHQISRSHSNPSTPVLPPPGSSSNRQPSSSSSRSQVPSPFLEPPQRPRPPTAAELAADRDRYLEKHTFPYVAKQTGTLRSTHSPMWPS